MQNSLQEEAKVELELLMDTFAVCKVESFEPDVLTRPFTFAAVTDSELSLVCRMQDVPENAIAREDGWRALRVKGQLDFSLTGILASMLVPLARAAVPVFAVSTFDTDYILIKQENLSRALKSLEKAGNTIV